MPSRPRPHDLRASDDDRERVVAVLTAALADGRLDIQEHGIRLERAYSARTLGDLAGLTEDLVAADHQPIRLDHRRAVAGFMTRQSRSGRWVVPDSFPVTVLFGEVVLDLREAVLQSQRVTVYATLLGGRLELIVPAGLKVELTGPGTPGSTRSRPAAQDVSQPRTTGPPGTPVIEVRTVVPGGRIKITTPRPPRRRRWPVSRRRRS
ncbi:MAG TPA: DUF1707 domain-containing protein [Streptosporangiaceae bacterium]